MPAKDIARIADTELKAVAELPHLRSVRTHRECASARQAAGVRTPRGSPSSV